MSFVTETVPHKLVLPPVPRPMNRRVMRRSWLEGNVRFWWMSAVVVMAVFAFVSFTLGLREWKHRRLVEKGVEVDGIATKVENVTANINKNFQVMRDQTIPVEFSILLPPDMKPMTLIGYLEPADGYIRVNEKVKLRVDPQTLDWTDKLELKAWWEVLAVPLFLLIPIALVLVGVAEVRRRLVLMVWRNGIRGQGVVVDVRLTAAAPRSRIVRFTLTDGRDRRVFKTLYPTQDGIPQPGQELNLIYPSDSPERAIIAELYARPGDVQPVVG